MTAGRNNIVFYFLLFFLSVIVIPAKAQFYTGSQMEFGKNRLQYKEFVWTYYSYDRYQVYFYTGGKEIANYVSYSAKKNIEDLERILDFPLEEKIQFIVFNKQSDYAQSNIDFVTDESYNVGGQTRIVGTKVILYYEGDHKKLDDQIREGVSKILLNQMMYGGNLKDVLKNSTLLTLPDWYEQGAVAYLANKWNVDIDNRVRDGIMSGKYNKFNHLTGQDALYAGHAIWNYIAETYGDAVIPNILYMVKVTRNIETAFLFVLGVSMKNISYDWVAFYQAKYKDQEKDKLDPQQAAVLKKPREARVYNQLKVSPDGNSVIYVTNELSQYKIWLYDLKTNKSKRILKVGHKIDRVNDYSYPLLAWHPSGKLFSYITETKGKLILTTYELESRERNARRIIDFEKILDYSYSDDGTKFAMSAVQKGQSDIYVFTVSSNGYERVTNDIYDDVNPHFVHNSKEIIFSSNRPDDTIRFEQPKVQKELSHYKDLFIYNHVTKSHILKRLTETPFINEIYPADYDSSHYSYLSDKNGVMDRYIGHMDSVIAYVDTSAHYRFISQSIPATNYSRNILEQDINLKSNKYAEIIYSKGRYRMYTGDLQNVTAIPSMKLKNSEFRESQQRSINKGISVTTTNSEPKPADINNEAARVTITSPVETTTPSKQDTSGAHLKKGMVDINNYVFENPVNPSPQKKKEKKEPAPATTTNSTADTVNLVLKKKEIPFQLAIQQNYYVNYATDYVTTQLDNSLLNSSYQRFTGGGSPIYLNPGISGLFKISLSDLFEDYKITGAMRLSGDLNTNEYFLSYENRLHKLDRDTFHRQAMLDIDNGSSLVNIHTHEVKYILKYPFSEVASLRGTLSLRNDRTVYLATDDVNAALPHEYETWGGAKLEYVFDNTRKRGLNLYYGLRSKVFAEYFKQVDMAKTDMYVLGFDVRYYQKIHRDFIWANRIAGSTSFGNNKLVYYLGGVDNWFNPQFDRSVQVATDQNYTYQTLATNMRGFFQNIRNGNSFTVINSELRMPIFRYLLNRPIKSDFINNFQIIGFTDVGAAWTGKSPYDESNSLNKIITRYPPITVVLNNNKEPIVEGVGFGIRSRIWGYFVRYDWAWGIEDGIILPRISYLSLSLDF